MRAMPTDDPDFEIRRDRLTGCLDAVRDLIAGQTPGLAWDCQKLGYLVDLIAYEAHSLLDDPERPTGGQLRAVE